MPPNPLARTTGIAPTGAGLLSSMMRALSAAVCATRRAISSSTSSKPALPPTVSWPVWMTSPRRATTWALKRVRVRSSNTRSPSELAMSTFWRVSPYPTITWTISDEAARAASSPARTSTALRAMATSPGGVSTGFLPGSARTAPRSTISGPSAPVLTAAATASAAAVRPASSTASL